MELTEWTVEDVVLLETMGGQLVLGGEDFHAVREAVALVDVVLEENVQRFFLP